MSFADFASSGNRRDILAILFVFTLSIASAVLAYIHVGTPLPKLHDDYAHLLEADTLAHGRLTNPPNPMAEHFETFHVLQSPTYTGKFPLALPLFLAAGERLGNPLLGAWLSVALGCSAVCWMLLAWFPARWSAVGGSLVSLFPLVHTWQMTYFGGGPAMLGGALVCGAAIRALRSPTSWAAVVGAVGAVILFNSRPFEGFILCLLLASHAGVTASQKRVSLAPLLRSASLSAAVLCGLLSFNLYYNFRVTGHPFLMPYFLHAQQYMHAPLMFWQSPHEPSRPLVEPLRTFHAVNEMQEYESQLDWRGFWEKVVYKTGSLLRVYTFYHWLDLPLMLSLAFWRQFPAVRWAWTIVPTLLAIHFLSTPWLRWNYPAPLVGLMAGALLATVVGCWQFRPGGLPVGAVLISTYFAAFFSSASVWCWKYDATPDLPVVVFRQAVLDQLGRMGGKHLVFAPYDPDQPAWVDIVYNPADMNSAPVLFARDLGPVKNKELLEFYPARRGWMIEPKVLRLHAYSAEPQ